MPYTGYYPGGYEDVPSEDTLVTAASLNHTDAGVATATTLAEAAIPATMSLAAATDVRSEVVIVDDGSATNSWPNRDEISFQPDGGSPSLVQWNNEYGELRLTPAKPNTVAFRAFSAVTAADYAARSATTPVFEVTGYRTPANERVTQFGILKDGSILRDTTIHGTTLTLESGQTEANVPASTPPGTVVFRKV